MVSSSKILTVSYGTFSCTAEGFEDPLGVVKDTTQFFRGVVREDRFFGAEPPQFDPELAAQLMQAQIDAEAQGGRLILRGPLADVAAQGAAAVPRSAATSQPASQPVIGPDADRGMEEALAITAARAAAEAQAEHEAAEAAAAASKTAEMPAIAEPQGEDSLAAEAAFFAAEAGQGPTEDYDYEEADFALSTSAPRAAAPVTALPDEEEDSVAAKLRRIRAVVSGGAGTPAGLAQVAQEDPDQQNTALEGADTVAAVSAMLGALASEDAQTAAFEQEPEQDDLAATLINEVVAADKVAADKTVGAGASGPAVPPLALTPEFSADVPAPKVAAEPKPSPRRVRVVKVTRAAFDAAVASGQLEQMDEPKPSSSLSAEDEAELARELEAVKAELAAGLEDEWDEVEDLDALSATPGRELPVEAAAMLAELEADSAAGDAWDDEALDDDASDDDAWDEADSEEADLDAAAWDDSDDEQAADSAPEPLPETLPEAAASDDAEQDDEEEEAAAFAAAFDDLSEPQGSGDAQADDLENAIARMAREDVRKAVKLSSPARVMLTEQSVKDNDASRILDETNTQLEEPEGNRRRSAIAHLRAAVAATRADRLLGRKKDVEAQAQPYREDLADVVRPRRPAAPLRNERPEQEPALRPAPLKLVAEQRVDETAGAIAAPAAPLRPRRVTLADIETGDGDVPGGFADYAESVGAHDLPELLEAAAAYLSYVEGRTQFSRPQLMTKVRQVEGQDSSREDRLRSFGQLLREGKIEKTGGGRFTVSDRISFKPSARAAG
ncbi:hypothetical protein [Salipiger mangrovisoli]|uniref:Lipoprotein n=1 Tax=Salipiger mangrovisoli TaxID=2865933 RepID=A0ABR9WZ47_9RHOB|nr:hypothetical protein [Salipiger mangrovisoli]MBE9636515.1 hypothetical protein [Salipiger mangrovisoli]